MFCSNCGKQIPQNGKFCTFCGHANANAAPSHIPLRDEMEEKATTSPSASFVLSWRKFNIKRLFKLTLIVILVLALVFAAFYAVRLFRYKRMDFACNEVSIKRFMKMACYRVDAEKAECIYVEGYEGYYCACVSVKLEGREAQKVNVYFYGDEDSGKVNEIRTSFALKGKSTPNSVDYKVAEAIAKVMRPLLSNTSPARQLLINFDYWPDDYVFASKYAQDYPREWEDDFNDYVDEKYYITSLDFVGYGHVQWSLCKK